MLEEKQLEFIDDSGTIFDLRIVAIGQEGLMHVMGDVKVADIKEKPALEFEKDGFNYVLGIEHDVKESRVFGVRGAVKKIEVKKSAKKKTAVEKVKEAITGKGDE